MKQTLTPLQKKKNVHLATILTRNVPQIYFFTHHLQICPVITKEICTLATKIFLPITIKFYRSLLYTHLVTLKKFF